MTELEIAYWGYSPNSVLHKSMLAVVHLFVGLVNGHLLGTYCMPKTVPSLRNSTANELVTVLLSWSRHAVEGAGDK